MFEIDPAHSLSANNFALRRLERVYITSVFMNEAADFTPWLNNNLSFLGELLGLDIVESRIEQDVGRFSCDILAKDNNTNNKIVIENQFGATNHDHLGKILTYASGLDAKIMIWIAEEFREEHQQALEWLNENSDPISGLSFFGIELRLVKIDDSLPAPDFRIIVKPNGWRRNIRTASQPGNEHEAKCSSFFTQLSEAWNKAKPANLKNTEYHLPDPWMRLKIGIPKLWYAWKFKKENLFVELVVDLNTDENEKLKQIIESNTTEIEKQLGRVFFEKEGVKKWKVYVARELRGDITALREEEYSEIIEWSIRTMKVFIDVLGKYVEQIRN